MLGAIHKGSDFLGRKIDDAYQVPSIEELHDAISISGLKKHEFVVLYGGGYVIGDMGDKMSCNGIYCLRKSFIRSEIR